MSVIIVTSLSKIEITRRCFGWCFLLAGICVLSSCAHESKSVSRRLESRPRWAALKSQIFRSSKGSRQFDQKGPYDFVVEKNLPLTDAPDMTMLSDFYRSRHSFSSPLVIISHGNGYSRQAHAKQAEMIASWGFHCLIVDLPNRNQWRRNGRRLKSLIHLLYSFPQVLEAKIDKSKIYLVGHSFGGSASVIAAAKNPAVAGLVLLDPAVVHDAVIRAMRQVSSPVILLGADKRVFRSRRRRQFFKNIAAPMVEISIAGATHEDAQYPSINKVQWGFDFHTSPEKQRLFLRNLIVSLFSITMGKTKEESLSFAWSMFRKQVNSGLLRRGRLKPKKVRKRELRPVKLPFNFR